MNYSGEEKYDYLGCNDVYSLQLKTIAVTAVRTSNPTYYRKINAVYGTGYVGKEITG
jgi:hypothetical protein